DRNGAAEVAVPQAECADRGEWCRGAGVAVEPPEDRRADQGDRGAGGALGSGLKRLGETRQLGAFQECLERQRLTRDALGLGMNSGDDGADRFGVEGPELPEEAVGLAAFQPFGGEAVAR